MARRGRRAYVVTKEEKDKAPLSFTFSKLFLSLRASCVPLPPGEKAGALSLTLDTSIYLEYTLKPGYNPKTRPLSVYQVELFDLRYLPCIQLAESELRFLFVPRKNVI